METLKRKPKHSKPKRVKPKTPGPQNPKIPVPPPVGGNNQDPIRIVSNIDPTALQYQPNFSDRFVYNNHFVGLAFPYVLPTQLQNITSISGNILQQIQNPQTFVQNVMAQRKVPPAKNVQIKNPIVQKIPPNLDKITLTKNVKQVTTALKKIQSNPSYKNLKMAINTVASSPVLNLLPNQVNPLTLLWSIYSNIGLIFQDRARITPSGFSLGEGVYSLSLAPGEEVTISQNTYTKNSQTLENAMETEQETNLELSSSYSQELAEGLTQQLSQQNSQNQSSSSSVGIGFSIPDIGASLNASNSSTDASSVTDAHSTTQTSSVKQTFQNSQKETSKYRTLHKTTFTISSESGTDSSSKRVISNPNKGSPIELHYFKIMQVVTITQERYGVQLCWAPFIQDPGANARARIRDALNPVIPVSNPPPTPPTPGIKQWIAGRQFGIPMVQLPHAGIRPPTVLGYLPYTGNIDLFAVVPSGLVWDGTNVQLQTYTGSNTVTANLIGTSYTGQAADGTGGWVKATYQVTVNPANMNLTAYGKSYSNQPDLFEEDQEEGPPTILVTGDVSGGGTLYGYLILQVLCQAPGNDPNAYANYANAFVDYVNQQMQIAVQNAPTVAQSQSDIINQYISQLDPTSELMWNVINTYFPAGLNVSGVEYWNSVFDLNSAYFTLYPAWWLDNLKAPSDLYYPNLPDDHFLNASMARIYLPIRLGYEQAFFNNLYGTTSPSKLASGNITTILNDLENYRKTNFASQIDPNTQQLNEQFVVLAKWTDTLPTDGTHIEVIQSETTALDAATQKQIDDNSLLRDAVIQSNQKDSTLKQTAVNQMTQPASIVVKIKPDEQSTSGSG